jgi:hypothetical protein
MPDDSGLEKSRAVAREPYWRAIIDTVAVTGSVSVRRPDVTSGKGQVALELVLEVVNLFPDASALTAHGVSHTGPVDPADAV